MASLMWTSRWLFVRVAPVSGQVKYTPDTERHCFVAAEVPWWWWWEELVNTQECDSQLDSSFIYTERFF